jgi:outer membrane protein OmpA-like peptidoglycan-associated protein
MRRGKSPQNINEEVNKMRRLMNFDISQNSHDVLSEQNISNTTLIYEGKLKGNSEVKKGPVEFLSFGEPIGYFRNKKMFSQYTRGQWLEIGMDVWTQAGPKANQIYVEPIPPAPTPPDPDIPISIEIPFSINDPFKFDDDVLYPNSENKLNEFIDNINNLKDSGDYPTEVVDAYYEFLKSKTIIVRGYASIDALSNYEITGSELTSCGGKKQLRKEYNKCLSNVRAEAIIEKLKASGGILSELNYVAQGMGETNQFSKKKWNNNVPNPSKDKKSPFSTEDTKKDRKFIVVLPTFTYEEEPLPTPTPTPDDGGFTPPEIIIWNPEALKLMFGDDYEQKDERGRYTNIDVKTQQTQSLMNANCIKLDSSVPNKQHPYTKDGKTTYPLKGDLVILPEDECYKNPFDIGSFLGIGKKLIPSTIEGGSNALLFSKKDMVKVLGEDWDLDYFFPRRWFNGGYENECTVTPKQISMGTDTPGVNFNFTLDNNLVSQRKWLYDINRSGQVRISNSVAWVIKPYNS